jgi:hypothetical protein
MVDLGGCAGLENLAKMYAYVSVKIADYGIKYSNWTNNVNNTLANDPGGGMKDWNALHNHVKTNGYINCDNFVKNRMIVLSQKLARENYARLYADVSVIIAKYGIVK